MDCKIIKDTKGVILNWLTATFNFLSAPVTQYLKNRGEIKKAEHTRDLTIIQNQARLAADEQSNNHEWEMESLKNSDKFLRRFSFFFFIIPIAVAVVAPDQAVIIYQNLDMIPEWNIQLIYGMVGGIWGLAELKRGLPAIVAGFKGASNK